MCNFFSCISMKDKTVIWEREIDNHHELLEIHKIPDNEEHQAKLKFARVEITPPNGNVFEVDLEKWKFKIDQSLTPDWFSESHKTECLKALECCLGDRTNFGGSLDLRNTGITSLPDNLSVGGSLDLSDTGITSLPDNLSVGGYLDLSDTGITSLPDNLSVGGSLDLRNTGITSLPDNLSVGGYLYLSDTGITSLPDNLSVGGEVIK